MNSVGRLVAACDDAGQHFCFAICSNCTGRLERLPINVQKKQLEAAVGILAAHPERYELKFFKSATEAHLFVTLEAERG